VKKLFFIGFLFNALIIGAQADITTVGTLPDVVIETSGLIYLEGKLITHNDSGNAPELYELDPVSLAITRTIVITNEINNDWEAITQDDNFVYIGDFGNNNGGRQDLAILKIAKTAILSSNEVTAERINFLYEDQNDFTPTDNSDFDAEAFFPLGDNLIVLTKQWQQQGTVAYSIPKTPGSFLAEQVGTYQVDGLVTGATFDASANSLYLVGYSNFLAPFFVAITNVSDNQIFGDAQTKTNLTIGQAQTEAITLFEDTFYVSSESFSNPPIINSASRLFTFTLDEEGDGGEENPNPNPNEEDPQPKGLSLYKLPNSQELNYILNTDKPIFGMGVFDVSGRMVVYTPLERISDAPIDISTFSQGLYYLAFFYENKAISAPFFSD